MQQRPLCALQSRSLFASRRIHPATPMHVSLLNLRPPSCYNNSKQIAFDANDDRGC